MHKKKVKLKLHQAQLLQSRRGLPFTPLAIVISGPDNFNVQASPRNRSNNRSGIL